MKKQTAWAEVPDHALMLHLPETPELHGKAKKYHVKVMNVSWLGSDAGKTLRLEGQVHDAKGGKVVDQQQFTVGAAGDYNFDDFVVAFTGVQPDTTLRFTLLINDDPAAHATVTPAQLKYFYRAANGSDRLTAMQTLPFTLLEGSEPADSTPQVTISRVNPAFSDAKYSDLLAEAKGLVYDFRAQLDSKPMDHAGMKLMRTSTKTIKILKYLIRTAVPGKYSNAAIKQHLEALELRTELYLKQVCKALEKMLLRSAMNKKIISSDFKFLLPVYRSYAPIYSSTGSSMRLSSDSPSQVKVEAPNFFTLWDRRCWSSVRSRRRTSLCFPPMTCRRGCDVQK